MCTGRDLVAGVARARLPYAENRVSWTGTGRLVTQPIGLVPFQARGILQRPEEQSRTGSCQGSSVAGQPQCPRLWHRSTPNARSLSHSPSAPPPSFTQSPYPPRSLVRDEQTHPHRPRLVVSHSTCPPLSSSPHANSFVIGPAVIKHAHDWLERVQFSLSLSLSLLERE
jgi:hypothetical protein